MKTALILALSTVLASACGLNDSDSDSSSQANRSDECVVQTRISDAQIRIANGCDFKVNTYTEFSARDYRITLPVDGFNFIPGNLGEFTLVACKHPSHPRKVRDTYVC